MLATLLLAAAGALAPGLEIASALPRDGVRLADSVFGLPVPGSGGGLAPVYETAARQVSNWRRQTLRGLAPFPLAAAAALEIVPGGVTRCIRLNNYWCIKRAGWPGEIGADGEGHTAFADAGAGADAAILLLRRYYLEFGRRSAAEIVRRWAPMECRAPVVVASMSSPPLVSTGGAAAARSLPLTTRGLGRTLRARWLASRRGVGRRGSVRRVASALRRETQPRAIRRPPSSQGAPLLPAPTAASPQVAPILAGAPEMRLGLMVSSLASPFLPAYRLIPPSLPACADEERRQRNYAERISASLGLKASDDLKLFSSDGRPLPALSAVLAAMSAFELGTLRADPTVIAGAVLRAEGRPTQSP